MKIMITGGKGMLDRTLQKILDEHEIIIADFPEADITDPAGFDKFVADHKPDTVIHCAAMTAVDKCEAEINFAYKLNAFGSANVVAACHRHGVRLIAISTDYVFKGDAERPYNEFDIPCDGNTVYGKSKFVGEEAIRKHCSNHVICRISRLYGASGPSFVHAMMNLADGTRPALKMVADQLGNPTSTLAVARQLKNILARRELVGTFHLTCEGEATWPDFAEEIFRITGKNQKIIQGRTEDFSRPALRPKNSRLDNMMLRLAGLPPMPHWKDALLEFMQSEFQQQLI